MLPVIVVTPKMQSDAEAQFGEFYPRSIDIVLDAKGKRAVVWWSDGWTGGSFSAERTKTGWSFRELEHWVT